MFTLKPTNQFKKDAKKVIKRASENLGLIEDFLEKLKVKGAQMVSEKNIFLTNLPGITKVIGRLILNLIC